MSTDLLALSLLGGVLALDATSVGQFMFSRPLVAGALAGLVIGDPAMGVALGATLELYLLVAFPTGGSQFPEGATATVVAVGAALSLDAPGAIPLGVAAGLVWGHVGGFTITALRKVNGRMVPEPTDERVSAARVARVHLGAVAMDFLRGCVVTFVGLAVARTVVATVATEWPLGLGDSRGLLLVGGAVSAGILLRSMGGFRRRRLLFVVGLAAGILGARFL